LARLGFDIKIPPDTIQLSSARVDSVDIYFENQLKLNNPLEKILLNI